MDVVPVGSEPRSPGAKQENFNAADRSIVAVRFNFIFRDQQFQCLVRMEYVSENVEWIGRMLRCCAAILQKYRGGRGTVQCVAARVGAL